MNLVEIKIDNEMYTAIATRVDPPSFRNNDVNTQGFDETADQLAVEYEIKFDFTKRTLKQVN